ncbi:flagellar protein FlaG [Bacillus sp. SD088]|uniref:flagellar protein FlaG n=1 Tax=Bacillus sp. SD088 TaxID=2782012 RepID=UPI001F60923B|nr:flagellar protein FlaG [Bacillus sp. SD088]
MSGPIGGSLSSTSTNSGSMTSKFEEIPITTNNTIEKIVTKDQAIKMDSPSSKDVANVVNGMNEFLKASPQTHLKFQFHDQLNEYYVTLVDEVTDEVVREIPPKKLLDMFAAMTEYLGIMVDKKI